MEFYLYLVGKNVPKDTMCGKEALNPNRREDANAEYIDCGTDGYLMEIDTGTHGGSLYSRTFIFQVKDPEDMDIAPWYKFEEVEVSMRQLELSKRDHALALLKNSDVCTFGKPSEHHIWFIPVAMFDDTGKAAPLLEYNETLEPDHENNKTAFAYEILKTCEYYYIDPVDNVVAFAHMVKNAGDAQTLGLPWKEGWGKYMYLMLVCSTTIGGGQLMLPRLLRLCATLGAKRMLLSSLGHVVWFYYTKYEARFIDRDGDPVDVTNFSNDMPDPVDTKYDSVTAKRRK